MSTDKTNAFNEAVKNVNTKFGEGTLIRLNQDRFSRDIDAISTSILSLDIAIGIGGYPQGKVVEVFGGEGSGKTTLALHAIASVQASGGIASMVDAEHALNPEYAKSLGIDLEDLFVSQPDSGEQALEVTEAIARSGACDLIVVDSVSALTPQAELDGEMGDQQMGLQARMMSKAMRKLVGVINLTNTCLFFINQERHKINSFGFGSPMTTSGGKGLKYAASLRIKVARTGGLKKSGKNEYGQTVKLTLKKNKVGIPFSEVNLDLIYGEGLSAELDLVDMASELKIVKKKGAYYSYNDESLGQGREAVRLKLKENDTLFEQIQDEVLAKLNEEEEVEP